MKYETALKLKESGFPMPSVGCHECDEGRTRIDDMGLYEPTLSELIEAVGVKKDSAIFKRLCCHNKSNHHSMFPNGRWSAHARISRSGKLLAVWGFTAEEAVANLWLSLHNQ